MATTTFDVTCACGEHNGAATYGDIWWMGLTPFLHKTCRDNACQAWLAKHAAHDAEPVDAAAVANAERAAKGV